MKYYRIIICLLFTVFSAGGYTYDKGSVLISTKCPGRYCGRQLIHDGNSTKWSNCGSCPRGFRVDSTAGSICTECEAPPSPYDWMYLFFMSLTGLLLQWYSIDNCSGNTKLLIQTLILHISALLETVLSAMLTLLISNPIGSLTLKSCHSFQLSDWYTILHNPNPNYEETLYCAHEAVYPLYSIVFVNYGLSVLLLLLIRPWVGSMLRITDETRTKPIYVALYLFPLLSLIHAVMAGLVYYAYPSIIILLSLMSHAFHLASRADQSWRALFMQTVTSARNLLIVLGHWLLHAYGIVALAVYTDKNEPPLLSISLLPILTLVPLPTILYVLLARFTDPTKFHSD